MTDEDAIEKKLSAARTSLVIDKPFLGALVLRMPMVAGDPRWCHSTATDARTFYYNPAYIERLDLEQTKFMLAHEALHAALTHFNRRGHRDQRRWDISCDYAINPLLVADGLKPPPGALVLDAYVGLTAEEIYPYIKENSDEEPLDQHVYDEGASGASLHRAPADVQDAPMPRRPGMAGSGLGPIGDRREGGGGSGDRQPEAGGGSRAEPDPNSGGAPAPPPLSPAEREQLAVQWQQRLAGAAQQAMQAGRLKGSMARLVDHLLQPQLPWRMLLARYMTSVARDDYSYMRPSKREGTAILPSLRSQHVDIVIVLDTSGSISDKEMEEFASEVNAIKGQLGARITLHACDEELAAEGPWVYEPWEEIRIPESIEGGGGTRFTPPFAWVADQDRQPDLLLYFTDAQGEFPEREPAYPVIWLVKGKEPVPWGQRIQLN